MINRRLAGPSGRAVAVGVAVAAVLIVGGGAVLGGHDSPEEATGPARVAAETAAAGARPASAAPESGTPEPVPAGEMRIRRPVALDATAYFGTGLALRVTDLEAVQGVARGPGEIAGPAVRLTVQLTNRSHRLVSLEGVVLSVSYGRAETPSITLGGPGGHPFGGDLGPGRSRTGRYVYLIPVAARGHVQVVATYTGAAPGVELVGSMP